MIKWLNYILKLRLPEILQVDKTTGRSKLVDKALISWAVMAPNSYSAEGIWGFHVL